jgi:disulfide oxidoreductase YuzD
VLYHDVESAENRDRLSSIVAEIEARGLLYPVTAVDGVLVYDGAVSYPAIMRAVHNKLLEREQAQA